MTKSSKKATTSTTTTTTTNTTATKERKNHMKKIHFYATTIKLQDSNNPTNIKTFVGLLTAYNITIAKKEFHTHTENTINKFPGFNLIYSDIKEITPEEHQSYKDKLATKSPTNPNVNTAPDTRTRPTPEYANTDILNNNPRNLPPINELFKAKIVGAQAFMDAEKPHIQLAIQLLDTSYDYVSKLKDGTPVWYTRLYTPIYQFQKDGTLTGVTEVPEPNAPKIPFIRSLTWQTYTDVQEYPTNAAHAWALIKEHKWLWVTFVSNKDNTKIYPQVCFPAEQRDCIRLW